LNAENPLLTKPRRLIEEFFTLADEDSDRIVQELERDVEFFERIQSLIKPVMFEGVKTDLKVAAVDGSCTPTPAMNVGLGMAIVTAGYMISENGEITDVDYRAKSFIDRIGRELEFTTKLEMRCLERQMALEALKKNPDILIIDGSFLFPLDPSWLFTMPKETKRKIDEMYEATKQLARTGKTIGIIKRSVLQAIEGELVLRGMLKRGDLRLIRDKYIMEWVMPENSLWRYDSFTSEDPSLLSRVLSRLLSEGKIDDEEAKAKVLEEERWRMLGTRRLLNISELRLKRGYIRMFREATPFEVEYPENVDILEVAEKLKPYCNEATGLPFILDLLDRDIEVERSLMKAYTEEVHARALDKTLQHEGLRSMFKPLNPEKEV